MFKAKDLIVRKFEMSNFAALWGGGGGRVSYEGKLKKKHGLNDSKLANLARNVKENIFRLRRKRVGAAAIHNLQTSM